LFVLTFSLIFILLGLGATAIGSFLFRNQPLLSKIAGAAIIAMGLLFAGSVFVVRLNREWRPDGLIERAGRSGPILAGAFNRPLEIRPPVTAGGRHRARSG
jgi:cytochrome c-type biogenesis protein